MRNSLGARSAPELRLAKKCSCRVEPTIRVPKLLVLDGGLELSLSKSPLTGLWHTDPSLLRASSLVAICLLQFLLRKTAVSIDLYRQQKKVHWSVCELQVGFCVKISKFRSFYVSWPSFSFSVQDCSLVISAAGYSLGPSFLLMYCLGICSYLGDQ